MYRNGPPDKFSLFSTFSMIFIQLDLSSFLGLPFLRLGKSRNFNQLIMKNPVSSSKNRAKNHRDLMKQNTPFFLCPSKIALRAQSTGTGDFMLWAEAFIGKIKTNTVLVIR